MLIIRSETSNAKSEIRLALTCLEARSSLIDDVNAALTTNELAVTMTALERLERILDLHVNHRSWLGPSTARVAGRHKNRRPRRQLVTGSIPARRVGRNTQYFSRMSTPAPQIHEDWSRKSCRRAYKSRNLMDSCAMLSVRGGECGSHDPFSGPGGLLSCRRDAAQHSIL